MRGIAGGGGGRGEVDLFQEKGRAGDEGISLALRAFILQSAKGNEE